MLAMVYNERQDDWDAQLPHVEFAYNNSVSAATGLAPYEVNMDRLPRLPLTVFDRSGVAGHHSLAHDHLAYCDLASERQQRANDIIREMHALTVSRVERRNSVLAEALRQVPNLVLGNGLGYIIRPSPLATARRRARMQRRSRPYSRSIGQAPKISLRSVPAPLATRPEGSPLGDRLLYVVPP